MPMQSTYDSPSQQPQQRDFTTSWFERFMQALMGGQGGQNQGVGSSIQAAPPANNTSATVVQSAPQQSVAQPTSFAPVQGSSGAPAGDWMANATSAGGSQVDSSGFGKGFTGAQKGNAASSAIMGLAEVFKTMPNAVPNYLAATPKTVDYAVPQLNYGRRGR